MIETIDANQRKINELRPFGNSLLPQIRDCYRVGLVFTSNAIEGFSYTESETKVLLEDGLTVGGKPLKDALAVIGHAKAYDYMFSMLGRKTISNQDILTMHLMLEGSLDGGAPGQLRNRAVFVTGSRFPFPGPDAVPGMMADFERWMSRERARLHPVEYAALLHKNLVFIHPFEDGNGRVSRLLMNAALIQEGYLPVLIPPVLRSDYIASLEAAHVNDDGFKKFIYRQEIESQRSFLRLVNSDEHRDSPGQRL